MECSICLDKIKCLDLVRLLDCGHFYHNLCYLRSDKNKCSMCRRFVSDSFCYCISNENLNFFELDSENFNKQVNSNKTKIRIAKIKEHQDKMKIHREKIHDYEKTCISFFKSRLNEMKFKILKASTNNQSSLVLIEAFSDEIYENYNVYKLFSIKNYSETIYYDVVSVSDIVRDYFNCTSVSSYFDERTFKNYLKVYI